MSDGLRLSVQGMHCASCASKVEKAVQALPGVESVTVNFATKIARVQGAVDRSAVAAAIEKLGYHTSYQESQEEKKSRLFWLQIEVLGALLCAAPFLVQMVGMLSGLFHYELPAPLQWSLASIVQFGFGRRVCRNALRLDFNMDLLVGLGTGTAWTFSTVAWLGNLPYPLYFESSAVLMAFILLGRVLEARAMQQASSAMEALLSLQPKTARVKRDGSWIDCPVGDLQEGDLFLVRPGEQVPVDGTVQSGRTSIDESMLTGESDWVTKEKGSTVYGGTTNQQGSIEVLASAVGEETLLAGIIRLVEDAQSSKPPIQRLADRVAGVFVPIVLVLALATGVAWLAIAGSIPEAIVHAVAVLVVSCPCALGLATPTVVMVATGIGAKKGILIRDASSLEKARQIDTLLIDKTGTLTEGKPRLLRVETEEDKEEVLAIAAALEQRSEHPYARAILDAAQHTQESEEFEATQGKGVRGKVSGASYRLGSSSFIEEQGMAVPEEWKQSSFVLASEQKALAAFYVGDALKRGVRAATRRLQEKGLRLMMLSGDRQEKAEEMAQEAGIQEVRADVLPEQKADVVAEVKKSGGVVGMVGDGVNDAPALASADVGFAMGTGTDVAIQAAGLTLMSGKLDSVADAITLSEATVKKIWQNLFFAFIYNILAIPLAAAGFLNPIVAGSAMALSSISVVSNALLLRSRY